MCLGVCMHVCIFGCRQKQLNKKDYKFKKEQGGTYVKVYRAEMGRKIW